MMLRAALALALCLAATSADACTRWWVGGGSAGNWNSTGNTNWATSSGGANNASVPGAADDVCFDGNSGTGNSTVSAVITIKSIDATGYTGTLTISSPLTIGNSSNTAGVVTWGSGMTISGNSGFTLGGSSGTHNYTSNGISLPVSFTISGAATLLFKDDFTCTCSISTVNVPSAAAINAQDTAGNHNVTAASFSIGASTITMGNGTWTVTGLLFTAPSAALTANGSTIKFTNSSASTKTFGGGGLTYNNFWFAPGSGSGQLTVTGSNTFADFKDDGTTAHTIQFPASGTQTVTTFSVVGTTGQLISLTSSTNGTQSSLSKSSGTVNANFLSIKDSNATGGATWNAGAGSQNNGDNTGWIFVGGGGGAGLMLTGSGF